MALRATAAPAKTGQTIAGSPISSLLGCPRPRRTLPLGACASLAGCTRPQRDTRLTSEGLRVASGVGPRVVEGQRRLRRPAACDCIE